MPKKWHIFVKIVDKIVNLAQANDSKTRFFRWITCRFMSKVHLFVPKIKVFYRVFHKRMFAFTKLSTRFFQIVK